MLNEFKELKQDTIDFVSDYVLSKLNIKSWDEVGLDVIGDIVDYIVENFEVPLSQDESKNNELLERASNAVTDITTKNGGNV